MILRTLSVTNFRNYKKSEFNFSDTITIIVGANAAGKTNLIESIFLLATGKSFRTEREKQLIAFGEVAARVKGTVDDETLEFVVAQPPAGILQRKYLLNGVSKRRSDYAAVLPVVLFTPVDLDIVSGQPGNRRQFLDDVLEAADGTYRIALTTYIKALRQRNALLDQVQKTGRRDPKVFAYWDELLITNGTIITQKREALIAFINEREKQLFPFTLIYDHSIISEERLSQYKDAEVGAGVTLVGPHRDDVLIESFHHASQEMENVKYFCSRGQQRLITLELKLSQISYVREHTQQEPLLLLDDIFSELDSGHIDHVLSLTHTNQTIITTTHEEFIRQTELPDKKVIELHKERKTDAEI